MFAAVAELERGLISERTRAALRAAKERGVKLGSRYFVRGFDTATTRAGRTQHAAKHALDVLPFIIAAQKAGAKSLREIAAALTARGIHPPSGGGSGGWHPQMVRRILARVA